MEGREREDEMEGGRERERERERERVMLLTDHTLVIDTYYLITGCP